MTTKRTLVANLLIENLKKIDGSSSTFDLNYVYKTNLFTNVKRGSKFLDEINDFPTVCVVVGEEFRIYQTQGLTESILNITLLCYVKQEGAARHLEDLIQDIEHVIYWLPDIPEMQLYDIIITSITTDTGILDPFGVGEVGLSVSYDIL